MKKAEITVQLIDYMGSDVSVVNAARISFDKIKDDFDEQDERLVNYLAEHNHWSPFAHTSIQVRAKAQELDVYMPITCALYDVIFEGAPPLSIAVSLMKNGHRSDVEFVLPHQHV